MLEIIVPRQEFEVFNQDTNEFIQVSVKETKLCLEHSLISLRKWEQQYHIPFIGKKDKTRAELISYIRHMTVNGPIDPEVYKWLPPDIVNKIVKYIEDPMTATWITESEPTGGKPFREEVITAEIIYYWMITLGVPPEYEKWHLNTLMMLIRVITEKNKKPVKKDAQTLARERAALNMKRRAKYNSTG